MNGLSAALTVLGALGGMAGAYGGLWASLTALGAELWVFAAACLLLGRMFPVVSWRTMPLPEDAREDG